MGVLGRSKGHFGTIETQGRGSLHLHILVWMHGALSAAEMTARLNDPALQATFHADLLAFLSSVISEEHPQEPIQKPEAGDANRHPSSKRPPNPSDADFDTKFTDDVASVVNKCNMHKHTKTCYKYGHDKCRFDFQRPAVEIAEIKDGVIFLRRRQGHGWVNNYNDIFSAAMRCNNDIKFISNGADSKALSHYITDYITKNAMRSHNIFPLLLSAIEDLEKFPMQRDSIFSDNEQKARNLIVKCMNKLTTQSERSGPEVASVLLQYPMHYTQHQFTKLYTSGFMAWFAKEDNVHPSTDVDVKEGHTYTFERKRDTNQHLQQQHRENKKQRETKRENDKER
jgi:hypothetical protein